MATGDQSAIATSRKSDPPLLTEPVINPEIGNEVPHKHVRPSKPLAQSKEDTANDEKTNIGQDDQFGIFLLIQRAGRVEVVDAPSHAVGLAFAPTLALPLMVVVSCHIADQISRPAAKLLVNQVQDCRDRCLLGQFRHLIEQIAKPGCKNFSRLGHKHHVSFHVAGAFVMLAVGDLPGEVGDQKGRVANPTDGVIQRLARRKGLMTALVCKNPDAGSKKALDESVECPECSPCGHRRHVFGGDELVSEVKGNGQRNDVASNITQSSDSRSLKAMLWNSFMDVTDSVVGKGERVPERVDQFPGGLKVFGGERRERG